MAGPVVVQDNLVLPVLVGIRDCLAAWFAVQPDPPEIIGLRWGADYGPMLAKEVDEACLGVVWVRLVGQGDTSQGFPGTGGNPGPCPPSGWAVRVEVGVARCGRQWESGPGRLPSQGAWDGLTAQLCDDMAVISQALRCCSAVKRASWGDFDPLPMEGNASGATLTLTIPRPSGLACVEC